MESPRRPMPSAVASPAPDWVTRPRYGPNSLASVVPLAIDALGLTWPDAPGEPRPGDGLEGRRTGAPPRGIVLVLADGLGAANLEARRGHAPFLTREPYERFRTGFPSTTVASLGSLGTGLSPGQTALAGYSLRDPVTGKRATLIKWDTPTPPETWQPHPTLFERMATAGRPAVFVGEDRFRASPMTRGSLRGARFRADGGSPAKRVEAALAEARTADGLVYVYWGELDKVGHARGWESSDWALALEDLDSGLARLAAALPRGWELWLTADHGMVDVTGAAHWEVSEHPALAEGVTMVAGEPRAVHLHTDQPEAVAARWQDFLGEQAWVMTREEAVAAGLFGPVDHRVLPYLGDVVAALAGRCTVLDSARQGPGAAGMVGHHGSLTAEEMEIPLLRFPARRG